MNAIRATRPLIFATLAAFSAACSDSTKIVAPPNDTSVGEVKMTSAATIPTPEIAFETQVAGYGRSGVNGWIRVVPGGAGGGRVVNSGTPQAYTDRVSRGEPIRVSINARGVTQFRIMGVAGIVASNGFAQGAIIGLPYQSTFRVSNDVTFDNARVLVLLLDRNFYPLGSVVELRVPIGTRPQ